MGVDWAGMAWGGGGAEGNRKERREGKGGEGTGGKGVAWRSLHLLRQGNIFASTHALTRCSADVTQLSTVTSGRPKPSRCDGI